MFEFLQRFMVWNEYGKWSTYDELIEEHIKESEKDENKEFTLKIITTIKLSNPVNKSPMNGYSPDQLAIIKRFKRGNLV